MTSTILLDCTLRDGGYYNGWDFQPTLIESYLAAMRAAQVDIVELGFRFLKNEGFKGPCAFTTDNFLRSLAIPDDLTVGVMINGADLCTNIGCIPALERLFPEPAAGSPVDLVRIACHFRELQQARQAVTWLAERGYGVGLIFGSPDTKHEILSRELAAGTVKRPALFLGDSRLDHEAARHHDIDFVFVHGWTEMADWPAYTTVHDIPCIAGVRDLLPCSEPSQ